MSCENPKCNCTNCISDTCACVGEKQCVCKPEEATCCCDK